MQYNKKTFLISLLLIAAISFFVGRFSKEYTVVKTEQINKIQPKNNTIFEENFTPNSSQEYVQDEVKPENNYTTEKSYQSQDNSSINIPDYAIETLKYIRKHNKAPENYVGGRTFQNREILLPQGEKYQEWDVHPKVNGKNRGAERLVTSSSKAYFTNDHYRSFVEVKE